MACARCQRPGDRDGNGSADRGYLTTQVFPRLGLADRITVKVAARGTESVAMVAAGDAALAVQPVSELLGAPGVDFVGTIPSEVQYISVFSAAVVAGSTQAEASRRLIAFLASEGVTPAVTRSGMVRARRR